MLEHELDYFPNSWICTDRLPNAEAHKSCPLPSQSTEIPQDAVHLHKEVKKAEQIDVVHQAS